MAVNQIFCEENLKHITENSIVWIHDYHLMLLPQMLRKKAPNTLIVEGVDVTNNLDDFLKGIKKIKHKFCFLSSRDFKNRK